MPERYFRLADRYGPVSPTSTIDLETTLAQIDESTLVENPDFISAQVALFAGQLEDAYDNGSQSLNTGKFPNPIGER